MKSLLEVNEDAWLEGMRCGFGLGLDKMNELRDLYRSKAMSLAMYYDDEAIAAVYKRGLEDAKGSE